MFCSRSNTYSLTLRVTYNKHHFLRIEQVRIALPNKSARKLVVEVVVRVHVERRQKYIVSLPFGNIIIFVVNVGKLLVIHVSFKIRIYVVIIIVAVH